MKKVVFEDINAFWRNVEEDIEKMNECESINIIGKYKSIEKMFKSLVCHFENRINISWLDFEDGEYSGYGDLYILSLCKDCKIEVGIEAWCVDGEYLYTEGAKVYFLDNAPAEAVLDKVLSYVKLNAEISGINDGVFQTYDNRNVKVDDFSVVVSKKTKTGEYIFRYKSSIPLDEDDVKTLIEECGF